MIYFGRKSQAARERLRRNVPQRPIENFKIRFQISSTLKKFLFFSVRKSISSKTSIVPFSRGAAMLEWKWVLEAETRERWGEKLIGIKNFEYLQLGLGFSSDPFEFIREYRWNSASCRI